LNHLYAVAQQFHPHAKIIAVSEYGSGNVNDTYRVAVDAPDQYFILQRINTHVFRHPELIMLNLRVFTEHVQHQLARDANDHRWQVPRVISAANGAHHHIDDEGSYWRALSFIDHAKTYECVRNLEHACQVGFALGKFHALISNLPTERLHDTLPGFHIAPRYLQHYDEVAAQKNPASHTADCFRFIETHRQAIAVLEDAKAQHRLRLRPIHGDPKVNNIMIDDTTGRAVSMIDLDTVKPGLVHYDIGDCLRSCCNPLGEETVDFDAVRFEPDICRAVLQGYLAVAKDFLTADDRAFLFDAIRLIPFELGLRFFTDYLEGNVYFKTKYAEHNLHRAVVQFKLAESIEKQAKDIRAVINELQ
jgi:Ser/Thr protein kinase RdoA (MazF antagonist)